MAYTSEIEKLEKRWAENPKGRNFAPLADAYRKAGELDRAIELCTAGLERHPDYVSAHIVFGRCMIDQKNDAGASDVFRKVLTLDPENVLALKILAEIAERGSRFGEAADWLSRLLSADPMNGDAAEALARAKSKAAQSAPKHTPEPVARLVLEAAPHSPPQPLRDLMIEHASEEPTSPSLDVRGTPADIETFDGTLDFNAAAHSAAKADGIEVQEEVELKPQDLVVEGLAQPPTPPPAAVVLSDDDGAADTAALSRAEPVLTETMAELYLRQGHQEDALRVYQALLAQRPADVRLRGRVESIAGGGAREAGRETGETVQVFLKRILAGRPGTPASEPPDPPAGSSLDAAFAIAHSDPEPARAHTVVSPGEATRPAADSISLDQVFGDEGPRNSALAPAREVPPPPLPAPPPAPPPSPAPQQTGGFSFDQFFSASEPASGGGGSAGGVGGGGAAASPGESGAPAQPPARSSGGRLRPPVEDEGDLDQFQAWLRGLKS